MKYSNVNDDVTIKNYHIRNKLLKDINLLRLAESVGVIWMAAGRVDVRKCGSQLDGDRQSGRQKVWESLTWRQAEWTSESVGVTYMAAGKVDVRKCGSRLDDGE